MILNNSYEGKFLVVSRELINFIPDPISYYFNNRLFMKNFKLFLATMLVAITFSFGANNLQAQGCPGGSGCTACNAVVTAVNQSFKVGSTYYMAANKSICGSACSYATGASSFEWMVMNCSGATILSQSNGFASFNIPCSSGFSICFRFLATTPGGSLCWSPWLCRNY
jgi:hypothetical protein